jgi:predicted SAM-dependent methyltransferase
MIKINLGCGKRNFGKDWIHIDGNSYKHIDYADIINFPYKNVDLIYASHVISYFDQFEIIKVLKKWKKKLKKNGILRLAVPDFNRMSSLYLYKKKFPINNFIGPLYGRMFIKNKLVYHKICYDKKSLTILLRKCGFRKIKYWNYKKVEHGIFDDHSQAFLPHMDKKNGTLISLNLQCVK